MNQTDSMDSVTETTEMDSSTETDEEVEISDWDSEQDEIFNDDPEEKEEDEVEEPQKPAKDFKKAFHSVMSEKRKLEREIEMLKSNKNGDKNISEDDLAKLREKYDEEDLEVIQKIIKKEIGQHESSKLAQKEEAIFLNKNPEVTAAQMKHLRFMQNEFGYSLQYAHDITFGKVSAAKETPKNHSIWGGEWSSPAPKHKEDSDEQAYADMKKFYWPR